MILGTFYPQIGGEEIMTYRDAEVLAQKYGWIVKILTRQNNKYPSPDQEDIKGMRIIRLMTFNKFKMARLFYIFGSIWHLARFGRKSIYDARCQHGTWIAIIAGKLFGGISVIKLRAGRLWYEEKFSTFLGRLYYLLPLLVAKRIVVVNSEVENYLPSLGISPGRIRCIPNSVDTSFFHPLEVEKIETIREHLALPNKVTVFLFIGRFNSIKGIDVLINAWQLLPENIRKQSLLVCVGRKESDEYEKMVNLLGIQKTVIFAGEQKNVREYYWASDVFVLPSRSEGLSVALLEAMSCGLPVITSNVGGAPDIVKDGESGFFFETENCKQLADRIEQMFNKREHWKEMGNFAHQTIVEYADIEHCVQVRDEMYRQLLEE